MRGFTDGKLTLESPHAIPTGGLLTHLAAETDRGFMVFDVFEWQEVFARFLTIASPIATEVGNQGATEELPHPSDISV